jgi:beta-lactamase regulating signal transducer with metallopeptidase domain/peroxiredoxin/protocatechuate 3,4-dioxygenase beta subunit
MSAFSAWSKSIAGLAGESIVLVLVVKWMVLLAMAWLAHGMLVGRNPRWRVALWRATVVGVALVAFLSSAPPIVEYRFAPAGPATVGVVRSVSKAPAGKDRAAPEAISVRESIEAIDPAPAIAPVARTGGGTYPASISQEAEPVPSAPGEDPCGRWGAEVGSWMGSIWLGGVLVLTVRLIAGSLGLARLVWRSSEAPEAIVRACRVIAERLGCRRVVRVRLTAEVSTPCLAGVVRAVLLLPERECEDMRSDDLRAILAHELAHARNHDVAWNLGAHVASIVLWFHPLAWRIRAAHAAACDAVCDAVAADLLGDVASYGRTLARLAVRAAGPAPAQGLAMARTSDVRRRLDALNRKVFRTPLSWRRATSALCVGSILLVLIGGFGFTRAEQSAATSAADDVARPADEKTAERLTLRAVSAATNEPIEGVSIANRRSRPDGTNQKGTVTTGKDGMATIDYPPSFKTGYFEITARKPKHVPIYLLWDDKRHPLELPLTKELRFEQGTTIGGIVKDEAGHPIEGAAIGVYAPPTEYEGTTNTFSLGELKTDAEGRWRLDVAPQNLGGVSLIVEHPHYRRNGGMVSRNLDSVTVLKKGLTVTGRVVDGAGRPIKGARAFLGHDRFGPNPPTGTTNERGEFTLENCDLGASIITVQAGGFAPRIQDVRVEERTSPVEIQLAEPGSVLRGKVVDIAGKPVAGAWFGAESWRGHQSIQFQVASDKDGRFEWKNAPRDVVLYATGKLGYMSSRHVPLIATDREQVVTLYPELVITGRVSDAETGRPLPRFRLIRGQRYEGRQETDWAVNEAVEITGGRYTTRSSEPWGPFFVRVEAPGYEPADSRAFRPTEGSQTFDFALRRGEEPVSGVVLLPDGKPAAGVEVVLDTRTMGFLMQGGRFDRRANVPSVTTGPDGRFTFTPPSDPFYLIAISDAGYAHAWADEFARSGTLVLQPWGKIEGEVRIGRQPAPNQQVEFNPALIQHGGRAYNLTYGYRTLTDKLGRFAFDRVVPVAGTVWRVVPNAAASGGFPSWGWQEPVEVKAGQTARVQLGGKGRPVIGRVVVDGNPEPPVDWTKNQPVVIHVPHEELKDPLDWRQFASHIDKEGRFRVEDVPQGKYVLEVTVNGPSYPLVRGPGTEIGTAKMTVTVPETPAGRPDAPLDLGTITAELFETLKVGDRAPDFTVPRIVGRGRGDQLRLSDYQGKLVLLDFWATWCGPCLAEMPAIKDIQKTFDSDTQFQLIGLSCDETAEAAERYIKQNGLIWTHGFVGNLLAGVSAGKVYKVRSIPATFLIGPDGRIRAKNLRGAELKEAVRKALEDPKLFPAAARTTQPSSSR